MLLCAVILGAAVPILAALPALPQAILAGNVYVITQGTGPASINESLATPLRAEPWAEAVSPEILSFGSLRGQPVLVRGVDPNVFFTIEGATVVQSVPGTIHWAFAGSGLASRIGLALGDGVTLVGSSTPRLAVARITGIFSAPTTANDELLVDFSMADFLTGLPPAAYQTIRVATSNRAALLGFLEGTDASVHVYGPGIARADVHSDPPSDERLANLVLRYGTAPLTQDLVTTVLTEGTNSILVATLGLGILLAILVAFSIHSVQARAFADRRASVGILRALGARHGYLRGRILLETLPLALAAAAIGAVLGGLLAIVVWPEAAISLFGHEIRAIVDPLTFVVILVSVALASVASASLLMGQALRDPLIELIRDTPLREALPSLEASL